MVRSQVIREKLSDERMRKCEDSARERDRIKRPNSTKQMRRGCEGWVIHWEGLIGECGFAQLAGVPDRVNFDARRCGDDGSDIVFCGKRIQVKVATHFDPHLKFDPDGSQRFKEDVFLAVLVRLDQSNPSVPELWGWITRDEFFAKDGCEKEDYRHGPKLAVKPAKLHAMGELWKIF